MRKFIGICLVLKVLLGGLALLAGQELPPAPSPPLLKGGDPAWAVVRIKSHGASATIIGTSKDRSYLLGCAHMLEDRFGKPSEEIRKKKFLLDGPAQPHAPKKLAEVRLLAFDHNLDLSLLEIDNGPFSHVLVAPRGHTPSKNIRSLGYDEMSWPITNHPATILSVERETTYTREKPWHGRSGGGLFDCRHQLLIGVVQGYEIGGAQRGIYVSHEAILLFLARHKPELIPKAATPEPWPLSRKDHLFPAPGWCPPGRT